ncbi:MAG: zf-HC2 domain-containing protein [Nitriliruptorales bacterium]
MDCSRCREAASARLDGELDDIETAAVEAHTARCADCARFAEDAARLNRSLRVHVPAPAPDLTVRILAAIGPAPSPSRMRLALRGGLAAVALVQLGIAVGVLSGVSDVAHVGRELGSWHLALGIGFLVVAWQPVRALGLFPVALAAAVALLGTAALDVIGGSVTLLAESRHLVELLGLGLLWQVGRGVAGFRRVGG